jgi:hypothetical protein
MMRLTVLLILPLAQFHRHTDFVFCSALEVTVTLSALSRISRVSMGYPGLIIHPLGRLGAKRSLREIGMLEDGIERVVETTMAAPYWNPRPLDPAAIRSLLVRAWRGEPPQSGD